MHTMTADDFRSLSLEDLEIRIYEMRRQMFNLRMQIHSNQLTNVNEIRQTRRNIARAYTVLREKKEAAAASQSGSTE